MFGDNTLYAVNQFKEQNKLSNDNQYHGIVGNTTWGVLFSDDAVKIPRTNGRGEQANSNNESTPPIGSNYPIPEFLPEEGPRIFDDSSSNSHQSNVQNSQQDTGQIFKGGGVQLEVSVGTITVGVEVIWYNGNGMDQDEYEYGFENPYFYIYTGAGISISDSAIKDAIKAVMKKISGAKSLKSLLSADASASVLGIWADSTFRDPTSYEGQFNSASVTVFHGKVATATDPDEHTRTVSVGGSLNKFGVSVSYTNYTLMNDKSIKQIVGDNGRGHLTNLGVQVSREAKKLNE